LPEVLINFEDELRICEKPSCIFNEQTLIEQNDYIMELESRVSELELKLMKKTGKLELLKR
jgi:hypothetical protein